MKKIFVNKNFFNDTKHITFNSNNESNLYIKNIELIKIINPQLIKSKEYTINNLEKVHHKYCANETSILYDKKGTLGYSMLYYKIYDTIDKLIENETIPYKDRIIIIKKLYEVFSFFDKSNFAYEDIHDKNIIFNDTDIKVVDLDCGIFKNKNNSLDYNVSKRLQDIRLAKLVLSVLYEIPFYKIQYSLNNKKLLNNIPDNLKKLFEYVIHNNYNSFESSDYLDLLTEEFINDTKLILK